MAKDSLTRLLLGNDSFVKSHQEHDFKPYVEGQSPFATVITCSDSRVNETLFGLDPTNRIFTIHNIGNQLLCSLGSVDYGIHHLKTPLLMVLGHVNCGAIKAAISNYARESDAIVRELDHLHTPLTGLPRDRGEAEVWLCGVERNVDYQVDIAMRRYDRRIDAGQLTVVGAVYDFAGIYGHGHGRLFIINVNGKTEAAEIRDLPELQGLPGHLIDLVCHRHHPLV